MCGCCGYRYRRRNKEAEGVEVRKVNKTQGASAYWSQTCDHDRKGDDG